ncbi:ABC transporter permease [Streptomyces nogalater]
MWRLALRTLKFRRTSFVATFLAMFLGAAIVIGCGGLMETGVRMAAAPQRLREAPVVVTGEQSYDAGALTERHRIDAGLAYQVARVDGVRAAVPDVSFPATVLKDGKPVTGESASYGHGWASARLTLYPRRRENPVTGGEAVLDAALARRAGVRPGSPVDIVVQGTVRRFQVSGIAEQRGDHNPDAAVFFTDDRAPPSRAAGSTPSPCCPRPARATPPSRTRCAPRSATAPRCSPASAAAWPSCPAPSPAGVPSSSSRRSSAPPSS